MKYEVVRDGSMLCSFGAMSESAFTPAARAAHSAAVSSCAAALHRALLVAVVEPPYVVVVPPSSLAAAADIVGCVQLQPVADVDQITGYRTEETFALRIRLGVNRASLKLLDFDLSSAGRSILVFAAGCLDDPNRQGQSLDQQVGATRRWRSSRQLASHRALPAAASHGPQPCSCAC